LSDKAKSRLLQLASVGADDALAGHLFGLAPGGTGPLIVSMLPRDERQLAAALFDIRAELVRRYRESGAIDLLKVLAKPLAEKPRHRPKGSTANAPENSELLAALDDRLGRAGQAVPQEVTDKKALRACIKELVKERLREGTYASAYDRREAEKRLKQRIEYQYEQRFEARRSRRDDLAKALSRYSTGLGLGSSGWTAPPDADGYRTSLAAALVGQKKSK
jgi:hypothetical protein